MAGEDFDRTRPLSEHTVYADVPNRVVAFALDGLFISILIVVASAILWILKGPTIRFNAGGLSVDQSSAIANAILSTALSAIYFVASWSVLGGSPGQRALAMRVNRDGNYENLSVAQGLIRWLLLAPPFGAAVVVLGVPGEAAFWIQLAAWAWYLILLITTARSPTKQGLHDRAAHSAVIKAARPVSWSAITAREPTRRVR